MEATKCARCGADMEPDDVSPHPADNVCQECWETECSESWWVECAPLWGEILAEGEE